MQLAAGVLLVLGKTARVASFSLNGHGRPINPVLARLALDQPVVS